MSHAHGLIRYAVTMTLVAALVVWIAYLTRWTIVLIYTAGLLAIAFSPIVRAIERQRPTRRTGLPRWLAILLVYLAILGVFTGIGFLVVPPLVEQSQEFRVRVPRLFEQAQQWLMDAGVLDRRLTIQEAIERIPGDTAPADAAMTAVMGVAGGIFGLITILILAFYFLVYADQIRGAFTSLFPRNRRREVGEVASAIATKVSAWLIGQLTIAGIIGTITAVGLWLIGLEFAYVLALVAALGEIVPYAGPIVAAIPAIAIALTDSPQTALIVTGFYVVLQQIESHLLTPRIMGARVRLSPVLVIVAILLGYTLAGVAGAILAIPTAAIALVIFEHVVDTDA